MYGERADVVIPGVRPGDEIFFADDVAGTYDEVHEDEVHEEVYVRG